MLFLRQNSPMTQHLDKYLEYMLQVISHLCDCQHRQKCPGKSLPI